MATSIEKGLVLIFLFIAILQGASMMLDGNPTPFDYMLLGGMALIVVIFVPLIFGNQMSRFHKNKHAHEDTTIELPLEVIEESKNDNTLEEEEDNTLEVDEVEIDEPTNAPNEKVEPAVISPTESEKNQITDDATLETWSKRKIDKRTANIHLQIKDLQKRVAVLDATREDLERQLKKLNDSVPEDSIDPNATRDGYVAYGSYAQSVIARKENLRRTLDDIETQSVYLAGDLKTCLEALDSFERFRAKTLAEKTAKANKKK